MSKKLEERKLDDDYPVHFGYCYVADGKVLSSELSGNVAQLKAHLGAAEITNCDMVGRGMFD